MGTIKGFFVFLSEGVFYIEIPPSKQLHITYESFAIVRKGSILNLSPCDHEESDTHE